MTGAGQPGGDEPGQAGRWVPLSAREHAWKNEGHAIVETIDRPWTCQDCTARSPMWDLAKDITGNLPPDEIPGPTR